MLSSLQIQLPETLIYPQGGWPSWPWQRAGSVVTVGLSLHNGTGASTWVNQTLSLCVVGCCRVN